MNRRKEDERDYDVGYGKPPAHTQFQKGRSGNPKGRPKGALNLATVLNKMLMEKVTVQERGRTRSITMLEASVKGLVLRAVKGDRYAMQQLLRLAPLVGVDPAPPAGRLDANDAAVLAEFLQRMDMPTTTSSEPLPAASAESAR